MYPCPGGASISSSAAEELGLIQVLSPKASIKIPQVKGLTLTAGDTLPLFQENEKYFIALAEDKYGTPALAAFARVNFQNRASAWVTEQKMLVFARDVSTCTGKLYLRKGENLPVLQENRKTYEVIISRYGNNHRMEVSKKLSGIYFRAGAKLPPELQPQEVRPKKITLADLPPIKKTDPVQNSNPKSRPIVYSVRDKSRSLLAAAINQVSRVFEPDAKDVAASGTEPPESKSDRIVHYRPKDAYPDPQHQAAAKVGLNLVSAIQEHSAIINTALILLITLAMVLARRQRMTLRRQAAPAADHEQADDLAEAPEMPLPAPKAKEADSEKPASFTGSLEVFKIKNLVQFLHNSSSTGVLNLEVEGVSDPGRVVLSMGEVKHAAFNGAEGQKALLEIFSLHRGAFRFQLSQQIKTKETIHTETSKLIEETAKIVAMQNEKKIIQFGQTG